ncbi:MAG: membrane protein insertion efficiency factor YidD [Patescibacteria group bacterium]
MMKRLSITLIKAYQNILSPVLNAVLQSVFGFHFQCRYSPTCSQYTIQQIQKHGTISGLFLGGKRVVSCVGPGYNFDKSKQTV